MSNTHVATVISFSILFSMLLISSSLIVFNVRAVDTTPPIITINFAGNLSDSGGPYSRPPGEFDELTGVWSDGYCTNDSKQQEDGIYINVTANDSESSVTNVWLQWYNQSSGWTNWTYAFANTVGEYWEYNTSGNIQTCEGYDYSFNIVANSTGGSNCTWWNKTGIGGSYTRRYVQLNCSTVNISYSPLYFNNITNIVGEDDYEKRDRLDHDQSVYSPFDTGYLWTTTPTDTIQERECGGFVGYWFDNKTCILPFSLTNIYYNIWWESNATGSPKGMDFEFGKSREFFPATPTNATTSLSSDVVSNVSMIGEFVRYDQYNLSTGKMNVTSTDFTDNDIYELTIMVRANESTYPSVISNRSFTSFIILNVPDDIWDGTDNSTDTDSDGLSDHMELNTTYGYSTNPFLADTDNDGINDYWENQAGSDPNDYTETFNVTINNPPALAGEIPANGSTGINLQPTCNITVNDADGDTMNVTFASNYSGSWVNYQTNSTVGNGSYSWSFIGADTENTEYWWRVWVNDSTVNVSETYHLTTSNDVIIRDLTILDDELTELEVSVVVENVGITDQIVNLQWVLKKTLNDNVLDFGHNILLVAVGTARYYEVQPETEYHGSVYINFTGSGAYNQTTFDTTLGGGQGGGGSGNGEIPTVEDTDGDGLNDILEGEIGTNPLLPDTDGDGYTDYEEYLAGTDPLDANDYPGAVEGIFGLEAWLLVLLCVMGFLMFFFILVIYKKRHKKQKTA